MNNLFALIFLLMLPLLAHAETLSLEAAARMARRQSPVLRSAREKWLAAEQAARQAIGYRLPSIELQEIGMRTTNPAEVFGMQMNQERFSMMGFADPTQDPNNPDPLNSFVTRVEANMPVFTGGKLHARTRQARLMARAARMEYKHALNGVSLGVAEAWMNLGKAREHRDLMRKAHATASAHFDRARAYLDEGMLSPNEVLRAEVYVAEMEEWVARAESGAQLAEAALNFQIGVPQSGSISQDDVPEFVVERDSLPELLDQGLKSRADLNAAREKLKAGQLEKAVASSGFLPEVGISARYDWYDESLFGDHGESWAIMGMAKLNLFKGGADLAGLLKARHDANAGEAEVLRFEEGISLEIQQAHGELASAKARHDAASKALNAGRENLRVVEERFGQGVAKMTDLLDAQVALRELEVRELDARYDRGLAVLRLRKASGAPVLDSIDEEQ